MDFPGLGIKIDLPTVMLFKGQGLFSALGYILTMVLAVIFVIWVGYSIYAGYKIVTSSMAKGLEEGINMIKNVWIGISMGLAFFAVISVVGGIMGIGDITRWHINLSQCNNGTGGFYFKDVQEQIVLGFPETGYTVFCCKVVNIATAGTIYKDSSFKDDTYHYIMMPTADPSYKPSLTAFSECELF
jgi:hypothetical protein